MKNIVKMKFKLIIITCIIAFSSCIVQTSSAQGIIAYSFGCIGNIGDTNPLFSGSIQIQANECLAIENGVKTMKILNNGIFKNNCEVEYDKNYITSLTASPNPITTYTIVKMSEPIFITTDEKVLIQLYNSSGAILNEFTTFLSNLKTGYLVQLTEQSNNGVYFLKASSSAMNFKPLTLLKQR